MIDDAFYNWTNIIGSVVNFILSNVITAGFFVTWIILILVSVISKVYDRQGERKQ